jgi:hypothetical protein
MRAASDAFSDPGGGAKDVGRFRPKRSGDALASASRTKRFVDLAFLVAVYSAAWFPLASLCAAISAASF